MSEDELARRSKVRWLHVLRWLVMAPAAAAAWLVVAIVGLLVHAPIEYLLCPATLWISGMCASGWVSSTMIGVVHFFVGLSAVAVEASVALVAPEYKRICVWLALSTGCWIAYFVIRGPAEEISFSHAAGAGGLISAMFLHWWLGRTAAQRPA